MDQRIKAAKEKVKKKKKFYKELQGYIGTSILLIVINLITSPGFMWSFIAIFWWGVSIAMNGYKIFAEGTLENWEKHELRRELEREGVSEEEIERETLKLRSLDKKIIKKEAEVIYRDSDLV